LSTSRCCPHCHTDFVPSIFRPQQFVCSRPECQRRRRAENRRQKLETDPVYRQVVRDSQQQWWMEHPNYQKQRRQQHPEVVTANRQHQQKRDQKRRLQRLVRNNLALDLKASAAEVWLLGASRGHLDRNNLASAKLLILQQVSSPATASATS